MPATVTHAFFTKDVFDILPSDIKKKLDINKIVDRMSKIYFK